MVSSIKASDGNVLSSQIGSYAVSVSKDKEIPYRIGDTVSFSSSAWILQDPFWSDKKNMVVYGKKIRQVSMLDELSEVKTEAGVKSVFEFSFSGHERYSKLVGDKILLTVGVESDLPQQFDKAVILRVGRGFQMTNVEASYKVSNVDVSADYNILNAVSGKDYQVSGYAYPVCDPYMGYDKRLVFPKIPSLRFIASEIRAFSSVSASVHSPLPKSEDKKEEKRKEK
jgi:hypothetical protein